MNSKNATFYAWLRKLRDEDSDFGDLARDVAQDRRGVPRNSKKAWLNFLSEGLASSAAVQTFERAWIEYEHTKDEI